jgi:dihydrofolate reductase
MGRTAYEGMAGAPPTAGHPFSGIMNAARKVVVFSRTLNTAEWANTTITAGDTTEEIDKLSEAATATSWSGAALAGGGRSCDST